MSNKQAQPWQTNLVGKVHPSAVNAIRLLYDAIQDHDTAIVALNGKINPKSTTTTPVVVATPTNSPNTPSTSWPYLGSVNRQTGTTYASALTDDGALILLGNASTVNVTLTTTVTVPWFASVYNIGPGSVVLTPQTGQIDNLASLTLAAGGGTLVYFDGTNFWGLFSATGGSGPASKPHVTHQWIDSYDSTTGLFTALQPAFTDISGVATPAQLPLASTTAVGVSKPDGVTITEASDGTLSVVPQSNPNYPINALVSGGGVVWVSGYTFLVSAATYLINGVLYSSPQSSVTLGTAHPTLDRIDVIAVNTSGVVVVLAGTAAVNPAQPTTDPSTQTELTFIYVTAASTTPTLVTSATVYDENTEWTTSGSASWNFADTSHPYHGTKNISVTSAAAGDFGKFTNGSPVTLSAYNTLAFYIQSKATWANPRSLQIQWFNGTTALGAAVTLNNGAFTFNTSNTTTYQQIVIPMSNFTLPSTATATNLKMTVNGGGGAIGFYLDYILLQAGTSSGGTASNAMVWQGAWNGTKAYASNDVVFYTDNNVYIALQANTNIIPTSTAYWQLVATRTGGGGSGTVTSVGLTTPAWLTVGGSPVTTAGTLAVTATTGQPANQFLGTPDGTTGALGVRAIVANDIPALPESKITNLTTDLAAKAPLASPALTGTPTAPTATAGTNTTQLATTAFVQAAVPTALPPSGAAGGDLGGTFPNPTVTATHLAAALPVAQGGTGVTTSTGSGANVLSTSPTLVTPALGTPSAVVLTSATGLPLTTGVTGLLPVANGGTGTASPGIVPGTNVTVTGTWPNQTVNSTASGGGITQLTGDVLAGPGSGSQVATLNVVRTVCLINGA